MGKGGVRWLTSTSRHHSAGQRRVASRYAGSLLTAGEEVSGLSANQGKNTRLHLGVVPSVIVIVFVGILATLAPVLATMHPTSWKPNLSFGTTQKNSLDLSRQVWVYPRSGIFYCRESKLYGKIKPGFYSIQGEALQKGYRPAREMPCP